MQPPDADLQNRQTFTRLAEQIADYNPEVLFRQELGELNFAEGIPLFKQINAFFNLVSRKRWEQVPIEHMLTGIQKMAEVKSKLEVVKNFSTRGRSSPEPDRNAALSNLDQAWRDCYSYLAPYAALELVSTGITDTIAGFQAAVTQGRKDMESERADVAKMASEAQDELKASRNTAKAILTDIQNAAQMVGVTQQAVHFERLARRYFQASLAWLALAILFGVGTYMYLAKLPTPQGASDIASMIRAMLPRVITITILLTGLVFCLRNFSAVSHNQVVNRHRQTALTTFQTFVNGTSDPAVKNAVLVQATQAIFTPQPSGYLKGDSEIPQVNQITEVVRGFTDKPKS